MSRDQLRYCTVLQQQTSLPGGQEAVPSLTQPGEPSLVSQVFSSMLLGSGLYLYTAVPWGSFQINIAVFFSSLFNTLSTTVRPFYHDDTTLEQDVG